MPPHITRIVLTALAVVGFASYAQAAMLALDNCDLDGCRGSTLTLEVVADGSGGWNATYTIDTTDYYGDRLGFNQIGFKAIKDWTTATVTGFPTVGDPGLTAWVSGSGTDAVIHSNIKSQGQCDGSTANDFACIFGFVNVKDVKGEYTWTFNFEDGTLMDTSEWNLSGQYANGGMRTRGQLISAVVPEPTAALLFGLGAILVTRRAQRR